MSQTRPVRFPKPDRSLVILVCLFLLALTPRLLFLASIPQGAVLEAVDAQGYDLLARNLRAGHGFSLQDAPPPSMSSGQHYSPDGLRTPLYPLFIGAIYTLAGERPVAVAAAQAVLDSLTALLVGAIAAVLLGRRAGIAAAILYALTPLQWRYAAALLAEVPLAFLVALATWLLVRLVSRAPPLSPPRTRGGSVAPSGSASGSCVWGGSVAPSGSASGSCVWGGSVAPSGSASGSCARGGSVAPSGSASGSCARGGSVAPSGSASGSCVWGGSQSRLRETERPVACGVVAGLAALCKPNMAGLALILAGAAWWALRRNRRRALLSAGGILLAAAAVMSPWVVRNWALFGRPFLSNAGLGFVARVAAPATLGVVRGHQVPPWSPEWEARYHAIVTQAATRYGWRLDSPILPSPQEADRRERQIAEVAWEVVRTHPWEALRAQAVGFLRSWAPQEQAFWYAHLSGRPWETTGVAANSLRDAVEILCAGRPVEAFRLAFVEPWARLDPLGRVLWYGWSLGHLLAGGLMVAGLWRLRRQPGLAFALAATILYATFPAGPIGYERFRVPAVPLITVLEVAGLAWLVPRAGPLLIKPLHGILGHTGQLDGDGICLFRKVGGVKMQIMYNTKTDLLYLRLDDRKQQVINKRVSDEIVLDLGEDDRIVGIEILDASRHLNLERLMPVEFATA